jgi:sterol desaturase/sphingolipid hydroxylase (fatty acid hydroxylase superfamily)
MRGDKEFPAWASALIAGGVLAGLVLLETVRPLRTRQAEPKLRRAARNLAMAGASALAIQLTDSPVTKPLTRLVERRRWGLVKRLGLPPWLEVPLALLALDYTLYLWHVAFHKVPLLWRVHQAHHVDLDLDTTTALRFHPGEMVLSVGLRTGQILVIGVSPLTMSIWGTWLISSVMFHHSNAGLPERLERWLGRIVVTPRMHGIHHSIVRDETDSNWSSGLTVWDVLHGTLRRDVPQGAITIGVPAYRDPEAVGFVQLLAMPFRRSLPDPWRLPEGGTPARDGELDRSAG